MSHPATDQEFVDCLEKQMKSALDPSFILREAERALSTLKDPAAKQKLQGLIQKWKTPPDPLIN